MNDEGYRYVVARCSHQHDGYIVFMQDTKYQPNTEHSRRRVWLHIMGLIETWDMIK